MGVGHSEHRPQLAAPPGVHVLSTHQSTASRDRDGTLHQSDGLGDPTYHCGHHLGLLGHSHRSRLVHRDDGPCGRVSSRGDRGAHLSSSGFQHACGRVAHLDGKSSQALSSSGLEPAKLPHYLASYSATPMALLTMTGEEATFTVAGRVVVPGVTATVLTIVVPAGTLSTVGAEEGGIF